MRRWFCKLGWHHWWRGHYGASSGTCIYCGVTEYDVIQETRKRAEPERSE